MNREEAFRTMQNGGYVTHPKLIEAGIGPLSLVGNIICEKYHRPIAAKWKMQIDSVIFNSDWLVCDKDGIPI